MGRAEIHPEPRFRTLVPVKGMTVWLVVLLCPLAYPACRREILAEQVERQVEGAFARLANIP